MVRVEDSPDPEAGTGAPLLQEIQSGDDKRQDDAGASISGAIFNISTGMVGAGIMSIPATFKVLGVIPSIVVIMVIAYLVEVTVEFLLKYTHSVESNTYGKLMAESFGKPGSVALQVCVMVTNLGALIIYLIIIGDVLSGNKSDGTVHLGILQEWFGIHWWNSRACSLLFVVIFVLFPLLLLRRIDSLRHASAVSVILAGFFVAICTVMAVHATWAGKIERPRLVPDFANGVSALDLFTTIPIFATAFGCHVNVHPVREELGRPSDMSSAVRISLVLCVAIYIGVGFFGYLLFGDSIMADMLVNFDRASDSSSVVTTIVNDVIRLSYAVHLMLVFPVMNYSLRVNVDELFFPKRAVLATDSVRFYWLTTVMVAFIYLAAVAIPNIWFLFQLMGTTTVMCIMFIFPSLVVLSRDFDAEMLGEYRRNRTRCWQRW
ncbi:amino acid transporter AVT6C-like isoform X2 [Andrographis paniculata]|uniref:amino acid transporter AVT6C-like isoform X2 n=1 Tax=Andrographis paniculata TaxID=175694 RepID=UPI0021E8EBCC|nr:amino acid transporter AVT6C-like isoform X2 [Andrographis paniculata]